MNTVGRDTNALNRVDDTRGFTSEALFSASALRLNRPLSADELRSIARPKDQFESLDILRIRPGCLPVVDLIYSTQATGNGQITNFFEPEQFGDINVSEQGAALSSPWNLAPLFDLHWRVGYKRIEREGIIEFHPEALEDIDQLEVNTAVSRFIGPDKLTVQFVAVDQEFVPNPFNPPRRNRSIVGGNVLYQLFRGSPNRSSGLSDPYSRQFDPGGWEFFGGVLDDREAFGDVDVTKNDYFGGIALRRYSVPRFKDMISSFDFLVQSTVLDSNVSGDEFPGQRAIQDDCRPARETAG